MTTMHDLEAWGEPPASSTEQLLADYLERLERGETSAAEALLRDVPGLAADGNQLVEGLKLLYGCAASLWVYTTIGYSPPAAGAEVGDELLPDPFPGEYRVRRRLGQGTYGTVWLADDLNLPRSVALKTVRLGGDPALSATKRDALRNDAHLLVSVVHPNVVQVYFWRQAGEVPYLVLQYVEGGSLAQLVESGPLRWDRAARYIADVGEGLLEVHAKGIVHRDIKPGNILWDEARDEALLTDFGVSGRMAGPGGMAGTRPYMAPEAFAGSITPAQDVFSLSATLFRLIAGAMPFPGPGQDDYLQQVARGLPEPDPRCAGMPELLERTVRAGLAYDAARRPALRDFLHALRGALNQLLADALLSSAATAGRPAPVGLRLQVSRREPDGSTRLVAATAAPRESPTRDIKKVPRRPEQVRLRTGDRMRIELTSDKDGYVVVLNVGPTGNLNLLYPDVPPASGSLPNVRAGRPLEVVEEAELTPPSGRERLIAVWSRSPLQLPLEQLLSLAEGGKVPGSRQYRATRDIVKVQKSVQELPAEEWHAVVVELDHG